MNIFGTTISKVCFTANLINGTKWNKIEYYWIVIKLWYISIAIAVLNFDKMKVHSKRHCIKLFYQISMLFLFGISYLLFLIILWQTLPNYWKNIEIFIWEWIILLPGAVSEILNIINHLAVIYYTTITVSISRLLDELNANLLIWRF